MKIELLLPRSGPDGAFGIGDQIEVSDAEGQRLVEAGKAKPVKGRKPKRTATADTREVPEWNGDSNEQ